MEQIKQQGNAYEWTSKTQAFRKFLCKKAAARMCGAISYLWYDRPKVKEAAVPGQFTW